MILDLVFFDYLHILLFPKTVLLPLERNLNQVLG